MKKISAKELKEMLVSPGFVGEVQFGLSQKAAKEEGKELADVIIDKGIITDDRLGQLVADKFGFNFVNLRKEKVSKEALSLVPELVARERKIIAFARGKEGISLAMVDPDDIEIRHLLEKKTGQETIPFLITKQDFENALSFYKPSLKNEFEKILQDLKSESLTKDQRDELTIKIVDTLLQYGHQNNCSDIHIEPQKQIVSIRFRIDGVMHKVLEIPKPLHELILMRIKILAKMRTDEHRAAQDGKFRFFVQGLGQEGRAAVDVRVSIVPITEGENAVMRLLSSDNGRFALEDLGLSEQDSSRIEQAVKHPHGMILVTGPTGCGKTTTLYAVMKILNKPEVHISTIEDPVEYGISGISQIQVDKKSGLTFAKGLRAIVRQDPDIIMVGEIRDRETAGIAVNSALTGHLVLSTLHTNDAATTLPRLIDMGVEPFLVASTVNIAIAQRLVRKICERCRFSYQLSREEKEIVKSDSLIWGMFKKRGNQSLGKVRLYKGKGCKVCAETGFTGRVGVFEILEMQDNIKELILKRASSDELSALAKKNGMTTMMEDGIDKVFRGITTLKEVLRVSRD